MTSATLRSLLVVGAALAALSVAACSKPAENTANTAESDANAAMASNTMSSNTAMAANAASNDASATAPAPASNSGQ